MENKELYNIAQQEIKNALKIKDEREIDFRFRGNVKEWDDTVYKNVFEVVYNVFKITHTVDLEIDANSGEILNWKEIII